MTTRDSSIPVDDEKGYNGQGANGGGSRRGGVGLKLLDIVLRFLVFASTLSAFVIMITNKQYKRPFFPLSNQKLWAKYHCSDAFMWFVVANAVAFSYALLTLLTSVFRHPPKLVRFILLLDLLVAFMIMSAAAAATAVAYIGENGLKESQWGSVCGTFHRYCAHVLGALIASYLGWLFLTLIIIAGLHRTH